MADVPDAWPFADAAPYYDACRPPYAPAALQFVAEAFAVGPGVRVLDLGCGPGSLAIPLSRLGASVVAVDPDPAMLAQARRLAAETPAGEIAWVCGRAEDVLHDIGPFRLVTFGQSLHWMDRDLVLRRLVPLVTDDGGLAILDETPGAPRESWAPVAARIVARYLGRPERHPLKHPEAAHEPALLRSTHFAAFEERRFAVTFDRDPGSILGCIYSGVHATKPAFGPRAAAFEAELRAELMALNPAGAFRECAHTSVWVARKADSRAQARRRGDREDGDEGAQVHGR